MLPVVISSLTMKLSKPVRMVCTLQAGFQLPGWKLLMLVQMAAPGEKRPEGVFILRPGGANG